MYSVVPEIMRCGPYPCPPAYPPVYPPAYPPAFPVQAIGCALQEIEFWSEIERQHTVALRVLVPTLDEPTANELARLEGEYADIGARARILREGWCTYGTIDPVVGELGMLVNRSMAANTRLIELLATIAQANPENAAVQLLAAHFTSETRYYQRTLEQIGGMLYPGMAPGMPPAMGPGIMPGFPPGMPPTG
ncbi:MAG: DUF2935 domain-containing protein [Firmicutes bacterium]|nr:DUF2935 domain-containing protein [Bacillota bacterium]